MKVLDLTLSTPAENLACDEALLDAAESGTGGEVLRFWESPQYFVVVGYANKAGTEVNVAACEAKQIPIFRRCSGGGTVAQGPGCLNYALVLRINDDGPTRNISSTNQFIMERNGAAIDSALHTPHSAVSVRGCTDLAIDNLKFSGNSQRRRKNFLLFHGTFLLDFDLRLIDELLRMPSQQPDYRAGRNHNDFITHLDLTSDAIKTAMEVFWQANDGPADVPMEVIRDLAAEKYSTEAWNFKF